MKKLFLIILTFFILVFIGYKIGEEKVTYKYETNEYTYVFAQSPNNELIGVKMVKNSQNKNEEIKEVFSYLTKNNSCLPVGYRNYVVLSTELEHYTYQDKELNLYLSEDFLRVNDSYALKQIYYSYLLLGFEKVYLYINEEKVEYISDTYVYDGIPFFLANPVYDDYEKIVNVFYKIENDYVKPVSYFIPDDKTIEEYLETS